MTSYAEMAHRRKRARPLYLELCALGLEVRVERDGDCPAGYRLVVGGLRSLSPAHADRVRECILDNEVGITSILLDRWDPDLEAIRREARQT